jgi:hypothetical protein
VATCNSLVPLHADQPWWPSDLSRIGWLRSVHWELTGDVNSGEVDGSAVDSGGLRRWQGGGRGAAYDGDPGGFLGGG